MEWITKHLAIGDAVDAFNVSATDVDCILNLCPENIADIHARLCGIPILHLPIWDGEAIRDKHLDMAHDFLTSAVKREQMVLVQCFAGQSRSPGVLAGHIALAESISFDSAVARIKAVRNIVAVHPIIASSVKAWVISNRPTILAIGRYRT